MCFAVFLRIFKIIIFVKFMFCDLVFECFCEIVVLRMRPDVRKPLILLVFLCISQNFQNHNFVKSMFCDLVFHCFFSAKSWFYACDPMCENHRFCLCFGVFLRISKIIIFVKSMFCDLVFHCFLGNRGFTHATRCAKTIDFACVSVYFSEFPKSQFS